ncbi:DHH family phosphoesterase, partial [Frankia sp. Cpl3]|nr:DHH family phosphoesterase [Frankia sp. Cpl3]
IKDRGFKLVVTVDTGISAVEQAAHAAHIGLDLIITDHHEPPALLPEAYAVINPKKPGCRYPFDMLAGVGVAFKVAHAILGEPPLHLLDLAAIGTISDLVPLVDENRILASLGLRRLNQTRNIGLQALLRVCGLAETEISAGHVGFALGPRINAGGRLETAEAAVKLLASTDMAEAEQYAQTLDQLNRERQELVQQIT